MVATAFAPVAPGTDIILHSPTVTK